MTIWHSTVDTPVMGAYGKITGNGNKNKMENGNVNWKWNVEEEIEMQSLTSFCNPRDLCAVDFHS